MTQQIQRVTTLGGQPQLTSPNSVVTFPERGNVKHLFDDSAKQLPDHDRVWLFQAQSGLCGMLVWGVPIQVNKRDVNRLVILQHGDEVQIGESSWTYHDIFWGVVTDNTQSALTPCGYCTGPFTTDQVFVRCPLCFALYHEDCWVSLELKRCCTRGCRLLPNKIQVGGK